MSKAVRKMRKPRDLHAISAHFRKAGAISDGKKDLSRKECRTWKRSKEQL
jgi:hypothetical protein